MSVPAAASLQILLLEDEPLIALNNETLLEDAGLTVITIGSCKQSLNWLKTHKPALAILDIEVTDGPCSTVAEVLALKNVPFVVHTGDVQSPYADTPFHWGIWLSKPCALAVSVSLNAADKRDSTSLNCSRMPLSRPRQRQ